MKIKIFTGEIDPNFESKVEKQVNDFLSQGNVIAKDIKTSESQGRHGYRYITVVVFYNEI